uniref:Reverse transcriptase domain-containing protein n=1 Tax=Tanacetum cinerariifolium TaxID=118510 RepID=A0A6L2JRG2_TANCI|nr:reverse transcriptase domain-containing protein [Tanacetum cinerariifolium]
MLRACPHHGFSKLTQIDTVCNGLNKQDQDSLNAAAGGNLLSKMTREALKIIKNKSKVRYSRSKSNVSWVNTNYRESSSKTDDRIDMLADQISNLVEIVNKQVIAPAPVKAVEKSCQSISVCAAMGTYNQVSSPNRASNPIPPPVLLWYKSIKTGIIKTKGKGFQNQPFQAPNNQIQPGIPNELSSYMKSNESLMKSMQNQINVLRGDFNKQEEKLRRNMNNDMRSILGSFFQNQALTSGTLPSNTVPNSKGEMKVVTTHSGLAYEGPSIPTNSPIEKKFFQIFHDFHFDISFVDALLLMPKFASTIKSLLTNNDKLFELAKVPLNENCSAMLLKKLGDPGKFLIPCDFPRIDVCHALADLGASINLMPLSIWKKLSLSELTPTWMTLELADRSITHFKADPRVPLIIRRSFLRTGRALIDVYREEITLRVNDEFVTFNLNQTMRYSSTYDDNSVNRVDVIDIACEEFVQDVLDFQYNSKNSNLTLVSNPSFSEETKSEFSKEPIVKSSSPTLTPFGESEFFLEEIEDFLNDGSIPIGIEDSIHDLEGDILYLEKLLNEDPFQLSLMDLKQAEETKAKYSIEEPPELELKELPSHLEYAFLEETDKLPVIIAKDLKDVEKEALIKVLKTYKRVIAWKIFGIKGIDPRFCTHKILIEEDYKPAVQSQRRVNPKIHDVIKKDVIKLLDTRMIYPISDSPWKLNDATRKDYFPLPFMDQMLERLAGNEFYCFLDGFSGYFQIPIDPQDQEKTTFTCPYGTFAYRRMPFGLCNAPDKILKRCEDTNLVLNWEKCHFMCKEGIVLGHKISKSRIEVDREKVDVIAKLPHLTTVKGVRRFLGHVGFYQCFIQYFSKIARPMTRLLEKETLFVFSKDCIDAFNTLKKKLTEVPILVVPDWNLPFELMCDASDFAIGAVLGQRKTKHFQPIHYASKTMTEAQIHYTTIEKEMLVVVYAFEKFQPYLVLSKRSENLVADHLSRLENPHKDVLENTNINENFRLETLESLSSGSTPWMTLIYFEFVQIKLFAGVCMAKKLLISSKLVIKDPQGGHHGANLTAKKGNRASWSDKFDDALWAFRTAFKTPIGCTPYKLTAGDHWKLQLNELRDQAYENSFSYKERTKKFHDSKIKNRIFNVGDLVLLFNSRLKIFSGKLKTRWSRPFTITQVFPYGTVKLSQPNGPNFKVNGHRVKHYFGETFHPRVMSSPNHLTSNIKDAFSSPNYTSASLDYSPASSRNTPSESLNNSYGLIPITSPTLSLFHDDPYMKVMHAYDAIIPPQVPISSPIIVPPSPMLSPIFNPQELFVPE